VSVSTSGFAKPLTLPQRHSSSASRRTAGAAGFLTFSHCPWSGRRRFFSLKNPRSEPYSRGALPKVASWRLSEDGADLLFQIISQRYERAPMVITTNRAYKHWSQIFNNDSTLTSAILDRVLHHADTIIIEGKSFRIKDEIEE
jgi:hypothetical protein